MVTGSFFPGTTAWRISFNRRQAIEGVNGMLKGTFVDLSHKFFASSVWPR